MLEISIEEKGIRLLLKKGKKLLDEQILFEKHNLMEELLPKLDGFLKKNKTDASGIKKARVVSHTANSYTTERIAKSAANAINWSREKRGGE